MNRLTINQGPQKGRRFSLRGSQISVGQARNADVHLIDPEVAESHLVLLQEEDKICIQSVAEDSMVLVNGKQAAVGVWLVPGDELQIGDTQLLFTHTRFHTGGAARRTGKMHRLTVGAVVSVLILEIAFIVGFSLYRNHPSSSDSKVIEPEFVDDGSLTENSDEQIEMPESVLSISRINQIKGFDDNKQFELVVIRVDFKSQREFTDEEIAGIRLKGVFEENENSLGVTSNMGFMPASEWPVFRRDQRRDRFYSLAAVLIPLGSLVSSETVEVLAADVLIQGTLGIYFGDDLQDEQVISLKLESTNRESSLNA